MSDPRPSRRGKRWEPPLSAGSGPLPPRQPLVERLTFLAVLVTMCVSAPLLSLLSIPYDAPTGSFLLKLHPGTWITLLALGLSLAGQGNPLRELGRSLAGQPAVAIYLATVAAMLIHSALRYGPSGAAFFIDTLLLPGLLVLLLGRLSPAGLRWLPPLVMTILLANELVGIAEQLLEHRLIPNTVLGGKLLHEDVFRATALMGHPLTNAAITGFGLFLFYRLSKLWMRIATCWLGCIALLSFGGRTALGVNVALLALIATVDGLRALRARRLSYRGLTGGGALLILLPAAVAAAIMLGGVGERIIAKLGWDESAEVRATSLTIYQHMSLDQILFGMSPAEVATAMQEIGLHLPDEAIENFCGGALRPGRRPPARLLSRGLPAFPVASWATEQLAYALGAGRLRAHRLDQQLALRQGHPSFRRRRHELRCHRDVRAGSGRYDGWRLAPALTFGLAGAPALPAGRSPGV